MISANNTLPNNTLLQGGKYKIVRFIASGGFGCTYEAEHVMLGKRVAIKEFFVSTFCNRDEVTSHVTVGTQSKKPLVDKLKKKFIDEVRAISGLQHQGIVTVTDVFEENGTAYFVMGYIDGVSIAEILKIKDPRTNKSIPIAEARAVKYIRQLCDALAYVHKHNRLHLDIKPANIMIGQNDNAILIDFGTSKQYDEESGENTSTLMGKTPGYAPAEQMSSKVANFSAATDIYAVGATLYKMLTGVTPPEATELASGVELSLLPNTISPNVRSAVYAAMQLQKNNRPQTVAEFLELLEKNDDDQEDTLVDEPEKPIGQDSSAKPKRPTPTGKPKRRRWSKRQLRKIFALSAVAIVAIAILGGVLWTKYNPQSVMGQETEVVVEKKTPVIDKKYRNANGKTFKFTGNVVGDSLPTGQGIGRYDMGTYTGEYVNGIRQGNGEFKGIEIDGEQNTFKGTFENDHYANGTLWYKDGSYFKGSFKNDEPFTGYLYEHDKKVAVYTKGKIEWL